MANTIIPIKKIFKIIDSCENKPQLKTCEKIVDFYIKSIKSKVINYELVREVLYIKLKEKEEELNLVQKFKGSIRRKMIKFTDYELELAEKFS